MADWPAQQPGAILKAGGAGPDLSPSSTVLGIVVTTANGTGYGSYAQFRSATGNALYITQLHCEKLSGMGAFNAECMVFEIGIGGAGSEVAAGDIGIPLNGVTANDVKLVMPPVPLPAWIPVAAGTRIAVKGAGPSGTGALATSNKLSTIDQANVTTGS